MIRKNKSGLVLIIVLGYFSLLSGLLLTLNHLSSKSFNLVERQKSVNSIALHISTLDRWVYELLKQDLDFALDNQFSQPVAGGSVSAQLSDISGTMNVNGLILQNRRGEVYRHAFAKLLSWHSSSSQSLDLLSTEPDYQYLDLMGKIYDYIDEDDDPNPMGYSSGEVISLSGGGVLASKSYPLISLSELRVFDSNLPLQKLSSDVSVSEDIYAININKVSPRLLSVILSFLSNDKTLCFCGTEQEKFLQGRPYKNVESAYNALQQGFSADKVPLNLDDFNAIFTTDSNRFKLKGEVEISSYKRVFERVYSRSRPGVSDKYEIFGKRAVY